MTSTSAKIGFDRFISQEWAATALRIRAGQATMDDLHGLLDSTHNGPAAKKKTLTVLKRLWLAPRPELVELADRGIEIYRDAPDTPVSALTWGMAVATYPFFRRVAEIVGRLTTLHGDCTSAEVHRRMTELYGEREGTRRMTNMVLQSQESWGAINRLENGKRIVRCHQVRLEQPELVAWLVEACLRSGSTPLSVVGLRTSPTVYPFELGNSISYLASISPALELRQDGMGHQLVGLRASNDP